jgi:hypothetical protein
MHVYTHRCGCLPIPRRRQTYWGGRKRPSTQPGYELLLPNLACLAMYGTRLPHLVPCLTTLAGGVEETHEKVLLTENSPVCSSAPRLADDGVALSRRETCQALRRDFHMDSMQFMVAESRNPS